MRRVLLSFATCLSLFAAGDMPPMPPMDGQSPAPAAPNLPKECNTLPPMIIFLPPPMEAELVACKNALGLPTKEKASEALKKLLSSKDIQIKDISAVPGFKELYSIKYTKEKKEHEIYCNSVLDSCFNAKPISKK